LIIAKIIFDYIRSQKAAQPHTFLYLSKNIFLQLMNNL